MGAFTLLVVLNICKVYMLRDLLKLNLVCHDLLLKLMSGYN